MGDRPKRRCGNCDSYEKDGHNYCRMCGYFFKQGIVKNVRLALIYNTSERFCGYCGGPKYTCGC